MSSKCTAALLATSRVHPLPLHQPPVNISRAVAAGLIIRKISTKRRKNIHKLAQKYLNCVGGAVFVFMPAGSLLPVVGECLLVRPGAGDRSPAEQSPSGRGAEQTWHL